MGNDDLVIVWIHPSDQFTGKALQFIDAYDLRDRVVFAQDPDSAAIDRLGIRRLNANPVEVGVPHPTTFLLDRQGVVRFIDVRENYRTWLAPEMVVQALARIDRGPSSASSRTAE